MRYTLEYMDASQIKTLSCQRPMDEARVRKIVREWDWRNYRPPVVARNHMGEYGADGQHTLRAMHLISEDPVLAKKLGVDLQKVPCRVVSVKDMAEASALYVGLNTNSRSLTVYDKWIGRKAAGDEVVTACDQLLLSYGFKTSRQHGIASIKAVAVVERLYKQDLLGRVLKVVSESWPVGSYTPDAIRARTHGDLLSAIGLYFQRRRAVDGTYPAMGDVISRITSKRIKSRWTGEDQPIVPFTIFSLADGIADERYRQGGVRRSSGNQDDYLLAAIGQSLHGKRLWQSKYSS